MDGFIRSCAAYYGKFALFWGKYAVEAVILNKKRRLFSEPPLILYCAFYNGKHKAVKIGQGTCNTFFDYC